MSCLKWRGPGRCSTTGNGIFSTYGMIRLDGRDMVTAGILNGHGSVISTRSALGISHDLCLVWWSERLLSRAKNADPNSVGVKALDAHTLEVRLIEPVAYFPFIVTMPSLFLYQAEWSHPSAMTGGRRSISCQMVLVVWSNLVLNRGRFGAQSALSGSDHR